VTAWGDEPTLHGEAAIATPLATLRSLIGDTSTPDALGWATIDLDRAQAQVTQALPHFGAADVLPLADDALLGARCRLVSFAGTRLEVVLLEPSTEARLSASLARFGEGFVARYVTGTADDGDLTRRAAAAGVVLSRPGGGPFGSQRLLLGGPPWGAHVVVTTRDPRN
jgi:hypothetical protein